MKKIIICLFLSAGLSGCHVYRTYERPDTTVTDSLYRQPVVAGDTASIASLSLLRLKKRIIKSTPNGMLFSINSLYNISLMIKFHRIMADFSVNHCGIKFFVS